MKKALVAAALFTLLVPAGFAQKQNRKTVENASHAAKTPASKTAKPAKPRDIANGSFEAFVNVAVGPGQSIAIDSGLDYTYADTVRISVRSAAMDLGSLQFQAYWSVPDADYYNATDYVDGSTFIYPNAGGMQFPVYGSQFRLVITNSGSATVNLTQILLFAPQTPPPPPPDVPVG
jgi:hypothetical protein